MKWEEHKSSFDKTSTSGNLGKPPSFLNIQFLIYKMRMIDMTAIWYPLMFRTDFQADLFGLVGIPLAPHCSQVKQHVRPERMTSQ